MAANMKDDPAGGTSVRRLRMADFTAFDAFFLPRVERLCNHQRRSGPVVFVSGSDLRGKQEACRRIGGELAAGDCTVLHGGSDVGEAVGIARLMGCAGTGRPQVVQVGIELPSRDAHVVPGLSRVVAPGTWTELRERMIAMADFVVDLGGKAGNHEEIKIALAREIPVYRPDLEGNLMLVNPALR